MKVAVVILNWNGRKLLEEFLPSVLDHSPEAKIYIADNASEDNSIRFLRSNFPTVEIIENAVNGGFAKGYNDALKRVEEEILILLNSDVAVTPNWIEPLKEALDSDPKTAVVQPKILDYRNKSYFEYAGAAGGYIDRLGYPFCRGRIFDTLEKDEGQYDQTAEIFWTSGACMAIKKKAFEQAGGFDEDFFAHQEEIDLCWRLFNMGYKAKAVGTSKVYHLGGGTLHTMHPRKTFFNFRNSLFALLKNTPGKSWMVLILLRLLLDALAGVKFLAEGKPSHTRAIVQAHFSFYAHFQGLLRKRKNLPKKKKYFRITSVVLAYYLMHTRSYKNL